MEKKKSVMEINITVLLSVKLLRVDAIVLLPLKILPMYTKLCAAKKRSKVKKKK